ncbi:MAG: hypothetical protein VX737_04090 [Pseudomonadota bacterium]|nr:hypothetical protein [Pseudomonadota bacterium]
MSFLGGEEERDRYVIFINAVLEALVCVQIDFDGAMQWDNKLAF